MKHTFELRSVPIFSRIRAIKTVLLPKMLHGGELWHASPAVKNLDRLLYSILCETVNRNSKTVRNMAMLIEEMGFLSISAAATGAAARIITKMQVHQFADVKRGSLLTQRLHRGMWGPNRRRQRDHPTWIEQTRSRFDSIAKWHNGLYPEEDRVNWMKKVGFRTRRQRKWDRAEIFQSDRQARDTWRALTSKYVARRESRNVMAADYKDSGFFETRTYIRTLQRARVSQEATVALMKFRTGEAWLGAQRGLPGKKCPCCPDVLVSTGGEDEFHALFECRRWKKYRSPLLEEAMEKALAWKPAQEEPRQGIQTRRSASREQQERAVTLLLGGSLNRGTQMHRLGNWTKYSRRFETATSVYDRTLFKLQEQTITRVGVSTEGRTPSVCVDLAILCGRILDFGRPWTQRT